MHLSRRSGLKIGKKRVRRPSLHFTRAIIQPPPACFYRSESLHRCLCLCLRFKTCLHFRTSTSRHICPSTEVPCFCNFNAIIIYRYLKTFSVHSHLWRCKIDPGTLIISSLWLHAFCRFLFNFAQETIKITRY